MGNFYIVREKQSGKILSRSRDKAAAWRKAAAAALYCVWRAKPIYGIYRVGAGQEVEVNVPKLKGLWQ